MYQKIIKRIKNEKSITINTLAGRSSITFSLTKEEQIAITNSKNKNYIVTKQDFDAVLERYNNADDLNKFKTGYYTRPRWNECPKMISSPYVAAIIKYFKGL
jgi:hypothetical protein